MSSMTPAQRRKEIKERHRQVLDGCEYFCQVVALAFAEQGRSSESDRESPAESSIDSIRFSRFLGAHLASITGQKDRNFVEGYSRMLGVLHKSCRENGVALWDGLRLED